MLKKAPGGAAVFSEWWLVDELSWSTSQSATFWESDLISLDASEWGMFPSLGGDFLDRSFFPISEIRGFATPPNLF